MSLQFVTIAPGYEVRGAHGFGIVEVEPSGVVPAGYNINGNNGAIGQLGMEVIEPAYEVSGWTTPNAAAVHMVSTLGGAGLVGGIAAALLAGRGGGWAALGAALGAIAGGFGANYAARHFVTLPPAV